MALSLILRNSTKIQACSGITQTLLRRPAFTSNTKCFSQLIVQNKPTMNLNVLRKFEILKTTTPVLGCRNISLSEPRKSAHGDHSKIWTAEKILSAALLGIVPATFLLPNFLLDNLFAVAVVLHLHWGLEACVVDYVRPIIVGKFIAKTALIMLYLVSAATLGGLLYFNFNDIGIGKATQKFWSIKE